MRRPAGPRAASPTLAGSNLDAYRRYRREVPAGPDEELTRALGNLVPSDDPAVTFASLANVCVPIFADRCQVELGGDEGTEAIFTAASLAAPVLPASSDPPATQSAASGYYLHTPFQAASRSGYPPYAGVLTHWWAGRLPAKADAAAARLLAQYAIALVDRERLTAVIGRSDNRAAELALEAISGRTINIAIGIVMHQRGVSAEEAEEALRCASQDLDSSLYQTAARVVGARSLVSPAQPGPREPGSQGSQLRTVRPPD